MADLRGVGTELRESVRDLRQGIDRLREDVDRRFERMDQKIDRHFTWMVGMLVGVLMGLVGLAFQIAQLQPL